MAELLIDTGASHTVLDSTVVQPLALTPSGAVDVSTPSTGSTPVRMLQYDVALGIPIDSAVQSFDTVPITESDFSTQNIDGLLGRDLLSSAYFTMDGQSGLCTLAF